MHADLADESVRTWLHLWHFVRGRERWSALPEQNKDQLRRAGWAPVRFIGEEGAGVDFLWFQRALFEEGSRRMQVVGWKAIPWRPDDEQWPVPPSVNPAVLAARSETCLEQMRFSTRRLREPATLKRLSLDTLGRILEGTVHAWACLRWCSDEHTDDCLSEPWSRHSNPIFWKLAGWMNDTLALWEKSHDRMADFSQAWSGPEGSFTSGLPRANPRLLSLIPPRSSVPVAPVIDESVAAALAG